MIASLENFECIKSFFIYCRFPTDYNWAKNIKKVGCITSDPKIICQKLIGINRTYIIPDFNYKTKSNDNNILLNYNKNDSEYKIYFNSSILNKLMESKNKIKNKYNIFCIKLLHYLSSNEILNDIKKAISEGTNLFTIFLKLNFKIDSEFLQEIINILKQYCFLSLYFHNYPYLFNLFSLQEIKDLIMQGYINDQEDDELSKSYMNDFSLLRSSNIAKKLNQKILNNECILDNKNELKKLHIFLLKHISNIIRFSFGDVRNFFNYYQIANYLRDFDICLILGIQQLILFINNKKYNFVDELYISLLSSNSRYPTYCMYLGFLTYQKIFPNSLFKENQSVIYESLTIKDFIVVGDIIFHKKIKPIEKYIKFKSFRYMRIEEISNYLNLRKIAERKTIYTYFYFLIIGFKEFRKNLENIVLLSFKTGIIFCVFLYIENEEAKKISKNYINLILPTILVYSPQDILNYLSQKFNFCYPFEELKQFIDLKIPKITFEQHNEDKYQNGCFELAETFDVSIIKNNLICRIIDNVDYISDFTNFIFHIYKEHNCLDLFYSQNCLYFGWNLYPELNNSSNICFVKRFLYMYCREEKPSEKSFYRIVNDDLRTRDPNKIYRYINILALINKFIEDKNLQSFNGYVYRATKLDEKLIMKLIPGSKMVNTTFWSTSKDFNVVEKFLKSQMEKYINYM